MHFNFKVSSVWSLHVMLNMIAARFYDETCHYYTSVAPTSHSRPFTVVFARHHVARSEYGLYQLIRFDLYLHCVGVLAKAWNNCKWHAQGSSYVGVWSRNCKIPDCSDWNIRAARIHYYRLFESGFSTYEASTELKCQQMDLQLHAIHPGSSRHLFWARTLAKVCPCRLIHLIAINLLNALLWSRTIFDCRCAYVLCFMKLIM